MSKTTLAGISRVGELLRISTLLFMVVLVLVGLAGQANAQVDEKDQSAERDTRIVIDTGPDTGVATGAEPIVTLGAPVVSNKVCPNPAQVSIDIEIEHAAGAVRMNAWLENHDDLESVHSGELIDPVRDGDFAAGTIVFNIPADARPGPWLIRVEGYVETEPEWYSFDIDGGIVDIIAASDACQQPPSLTVEEPIVSGPVCPNSADVSIAYDAVAFAGIRSVAIDATSRAFPFSYGDIVEFDYVQPSVDGTFDFTLPANSESGTWDVTIEVLDLQYSVIASASTTFDIERQTNGCSDPRPSITLGPPVTSGPICPNVASVEIPYSVIAPNRAELIEVTGRSDGFPYDWSDTIVLPNQPRTGEGTYRFTPPRATQSGTWTMTFKVLDTWLYADSDTTTFEIVANPGCAPSLSVTSATVSNPVCPDPATLAVDYVIADALSEITGLVVVATDPVGIEFAGPLLEEKTDYGHDEVFVRDGDRVTGTTIIELPPNARAGTWDVTVAALVDTIGARDPLEVTVPVTVERDASDCQPEEPPAIAIESIEISGPVCPSNAIVTATVVASNDRGIQELEIQGDLGGLDLFLQRVKPNATSANETFIIDLPPGQAPGRYLVQATMIDNSERVTASEPAFVEVKRSKDCDIEEPTIVIDDLVVCPSQGRLTVEFTATDHTGLREIGARAFLAADSRLEAPDDSFSTRLHHEENYTATFSFVLPPADELAEYPQLALYAVDFDWNQDSVVEYLDLDGRDDCAPLTPGPSPQPTVEPTPGPVAPNPAPVSYWDDEDASEAANGVMTPPTLGDAAATVTPQPSKPPPTQIAFTGSNSALAGQAGLMLFAAGFVVSVLARQRQRRAKQ